MRFIWLLGNNRIELYTCPCLYTVIKNVRKFKSYLRERVCLHHWHSAKSESAAIKLIKFVHQVVHFSRQEIVGPWFPTLQTSPWCGRGAVYCNRGSSGSRLVALVIDKRYLPCLAQRSIYHVPLAHLPPRTSGQRFPIYTPNVLSMRWQSRTHDLGNGNVAQV